MQDYLCINKKTGVLMNNKECKKNNGMYILKSDYLSPDDGWTCNSNGQPYYTKTECDINHGTYRKTKPVVIYDDNKYNNIFENRDMSRTIMIFLFMILITTYIVHNYIKHNAYLVEIVAVTILIFLIILTFCPFGVCTLEPSSNNFRRNPIGYIYKQICIFLSIFKINLC